MAIDGYGFGVTFFLTHKLMVLSLCMTSLMDID
jgi:hypothetical protein